MKTMAAATKRWKTKTAGFCSTTRLLVYLFSAARGPQLIRGQQGDQHHDQNHRPRRDARKFLSPDIQVEQQPESFVEQPEIESVVEQRGAERIPLVGAGLREDDVDVLADTSEQSQRLLQHAGFLQQQVEEETEATTTTLASTLSSAAATSTSSDFLEEQKASSSIWVDEAGEVVDAVEAGGRASTSNDHDFLLMSGSTSSATGTASASASSGASGGSVESSSFVTRQVKTAEATNHGEGATERTSHTSVLLPPLSAGLGSGVGNGKNKLNLAPKTAEATNQGSVPQGGQAPLPTLLGAGRVRPQVGPPSSKDGQKMEQTNANVEQARAGRASRYASPRDKNIGVKTIGGGGVVAATGEKEARGNGKGQEIKHDTKTKSEKSGPSSFWFPSFSSLKDNVSSLKNKALAQVEKVKNSAVGLGSHMVKKFKESEFVKSLRRHAGQALDKAKGAAEQATLMGMQALDNYVRGNPCQLPISLDSAPTTAQEDNQVITAGPQLFLATRQVTLPNGQTRAQTKFVAAPSRDTGTWKSFFLQPWIGMFDEKKSTTLSSSDPHTTRSSTDAAAPATAGGREEKNFDKTEWHAVAVLSGGLKQQTVCSAGLVPVTASLVRHAAPFTSPAGCRSLERAFVKDPQPVQEVISCPTPLQEGAKGWSKFAAGMAGRFVANVDRMEHIDEKIHFRIAAEEVGPEFETFQVAQRILLSFPSKTDKEMPAKATMVAELELHSRLAVRAALATGAFDLDHGAGAVSLRILDETSTGTNGLKYNDVAAYTNSHNGYTALVFQSHAYCPLMQRKKTVEWMVVGEGGNRLKVSMDQTKTRPLILSTRMVDWRWRNREQEDPNPKSTKFFAQLQELGAEAKAFWHGSRPLVNDFFEDYKRQSGVLQKEWYFQDQLDRFLTKTFPKGESVTEMEKAQQRIGAILDKATSYLVLADFEPSSADREMPHLPCDCSALPIHQNFAATRSDVAAGRKLLIGELVVPHDEDADELLDEAANNADWCEKHLAGKVIADGLDKMRVTLDHVGGNGAGAVNTAKPPKQALKLCLRTGDHVAQEVTRYIPEDMLLAALDLHRSGDEPTSGPKPPAIVKVESVKPYAGAARTPRFGRCQLRLMASSDDLLSAFVEEQLRDIRAETARKEEKESVRASRLSSVRGELVKELDAHVRQKKAVESDMASKHMELPEDAQQCERELKELYDKQELIQLRALGPNRSARADASNRGSTLDSTRRRADDFSEVEEGQRSRDDAEELDELTLNEKYLTPLKAKLDECADRINRIYPPGTPSAWSKLTDYHGSEKAKQIQKEEEQRRYAELLRVLDEALSKDIEAYQDKLPKRGQDHPDPQQQQQGPRLQGLRKLGAIAMNAVEEKRRKIQEAKNRGNYPNKLNEFLAREFAEQEKIMRKKLQKKTDKIISAQETKLELRSQQKKGKAGSGKNTKGAAHEQAEKIVVEAGCGPKNSKQMLTLCPASTRVIKSTSFLQADDIKTEILQAVFNVDTPSKLLNSAAEAQRLISARGYSEKDADGNPRVSILPLNVAALVSYGENKLSGAVEDRLTPDKGRDDNEKGFVQRKVEEAIGLMGGTVENLVEAVLSGVFVRITDPRLSGEVETTEKQQQGIFKLKHPQKQQGSSQRLHRLPEMVQRDIFGGERELKRQLSLTLDGQSRGTRSDDRRTVLDVRGKGGLVDVWPLVTLTLGVVDVLDQLLPAQSILDKPQVFAQIENVLTDLVVPKLNELFDLRFFQNLLVSFDFFRRAYLQIDQKPAQCSVEQLLDPGASATCRALRGSTSPNQSPEATKAQAATCPCRWVSFETAKNCPRALWSEVDSTSREGSRRPLAEQDDATLLPPGAVRLYVLHVASCMAPSGAQPCEMRVYDKYQSHELAEEAKRVHDEVRNPERQAGWFAGKKVRDADKKAAAEGRDLAAHYENEVKLAFFHHIPPSVYRDVLRPLLGVRKWVALIVEDDSHRGGNHAKVRNSFSSMSSPCSVKLFTELSGALEKELALLELETAKQTAEAIANAVAASSHSDALGDSAVSSESKGRRKFKYFPFFNFGPNKEIEEKLNALLEEKKKRQDTLRTINGKKWKKKLGNKKTWRIDDGALSLFKFERFQFQVTTEIDASNGYPKRKLVLGCMFHFDEKAGGVWKIQSRGGDGSRSTCTEEDVTYANMRPPKSSLGPLPTAMPSP
ncbi:unnamed protein product [Amoebophrya sp. A120]|nr:unnamed protein product [Amoebophrya sp. A120]|eukprot:GSA120T00019761001.1